MNIEKLEALIKNMSKDQYLKFEGAVFELLQENNLFTSIELEIIDKKIQHQKHLNREKVLMTNN